MASAGVVGNTRILKAILHPYKDDEDVKKMEKSIADQLAVNDIFQ
ncbi:hypothetical protein [Butyrivibrio sp. INlla14]|nr:hypothetical protein [Butyrivibrio sp. INlla14]SCY10331.1 hypothetical protein SAMN02910371_01070 [Butyrivibrio sp. INlla14]